jgi:hypothetical protein
MNLHFEILISIAHFNGYFSQIKSNSLNSSDEPLLRQILSQIPRIHKIISINLASRPELQHSSIKSSMKAMFSLV